MTKTPRLPVALIILCGLSCGGGPAWHKGTLLYFDTVCELQLYCSPSAYAEAEAEIERVFDRITRYFSPGAREFEAPEVLALYQVARDVFERSSGCFDLTVAPLSRLWGFRSRAFRVPTSQEIACTLKSVGMERIQLLPGRLEVPDDMELDWGAVAKGYGLDLAAQALRRQKISRGFINAGGDIYCWGRNPRGLAWQVAIDHPRGQGYLGVLSLSGSGAATTGDYHRFFTREGVRYHHVFDPRSGRPARGKQSVTVVGPSTGLCDALSTALFVSDRPEEILRHYPEYGAFLVDDSGRLTSLGREFELRPWPQTGAGTTCAAGPS